MLSRIVNSVLRRGTEPSVQDQPIDNESEEEIHYDCTVYKIDGTSVELVRPQSKARLADKALELLDRDDLQSQDLVLPYKQICAIRQHQPNTAQFLFQQDITKLSESIEYGFHFGNSYDAFLFRNDLLAGLYTTTSPLLQTNASVSLYSPETKSFHAFVDVTPMVLSRRDTDGMSLLSLISADEETILHFELTKDIQFWPTEQNKEFTVWGPFVNKKQTKEMIRSLLLFRLADISDLDAGEVFKMLNMLVGYEEKLLDGENACRDFETSKATDLGDDLEMMWDGASKGSLSDREEAEIENEDIRNEKEAEAVEAEENARNKANHWKRASNRRSIIESVDPTDRIIERDPEAQLHRFMQVGESCSLVCRGAQSPSWKKSKKANFNMQVYGQAGNEGKLSNVSTITGDKIIPTQGVLHSGETKLLLGNSSDKARIHYMDLEREKIITEFKTGDLDAELIFNTFKGASASGDPTFMCANNRAFYMMDSRQKNARGHSLIYQTNPNFTAAGCDEFGHIVLGNKIGQLRLYDGEPNEKSNFKIAKTQLDAIKEPIKAVDTNADGSWIVATMRTCLVVYPTKLKHTGRTGFETRLGQYKPPAVYLRLSKEDVMKYELQDIDFQPAVFDNAGRSILTSTGNLAIVWDFKSVKKGALDKYRIKITPSYIKGSSALADGSVIVAYPQGLDILGVKPNRSTR